MQIFEPKLILGLGNLVALALLAVLPLSSKAQAKKPSWWKQARMPAHAIDTALYRDSNHIFLRPPLGIYMDPLTCIDNFNVAWKFGVEAPLGKECGMQLGGIFSDGSWQGYGARVSFRRYLQPDFKFKPTKRQLRGKKSLLESVAHRTYIALDLTWREASYTESDSLRRGKVNITYGVEKTVYTAALLYGYSITLRCGIGIQFYAGAGVRVKEGRNTLTQAQVNDLHHWYEGDIDRNAGANTSYATIWPVLPIGVRLSYRLR